jgi:hypothetical protein
MISVWEIALVFLILLIVVLPLFVKTLRGARLYNIGIYALVALLVVLVMFLMKTVFRLYMILFGMAILLVIILFATIYSKSRHD